MHAKICKLSLKSNVVSMLKIYYRLGQLQDIHKVVIQLEAKVQPRLLIE